MHLLQPGDYRRTLGAASPPVPFPLPFPSPCRTQIIHLRRLVPTSRLRCRCRRMGVKEKWVQAGSRGTMQQQASIAGRPGRYSIVPGASQPARAWGGGGGCVLSETKRYETRRHPTRTQSLCAHLRPKRSHDRQAMMRFSSSLRGCSWPVVVLEWLLLHASARGGSEVCKGKKEIP